MIHFVTHVGGGRGENIRGRREEKERGEKNLRERIVEMEGQK